MTVELDVIVAAVTGALTGGSVRPLLAPADAVAEVWKEAIKDRLQTTAWRASRKRTDSRSEPIERTAIRALSDAALTDAPIVQEYLAGVIAGATINNDKAHILSLIARLTPAQLRLHYQLHFGATVFVRNELDGPNRWRSMLTKSHDAMERKFACSLQSLGLPTDLEPRIRWGRAMIHLQREGLIRDFEDYEELENEASCFFFGLTDYGVELFSTALGFREGGLADLCLARPDELLLDPPMAPPRVVGAAEESARLLTLIETRDDATETPEDPF